MDRPGTRVAFHSVTMKNSISLRFALVCSLSLACLSSAHAENKKQVDDAIFGGSSTAGKNFLQGLMSAVELGGAGALYQWSKMMTLEQKAVVDAKVALDNELRPHFKSQADLVREIDRLEVQVSLLERARNRMLEHGEQWGPDGKAKLMKMGDQRLALENELRALRAPNALQTYHPPAQRAKITQARVRFEGAIAAERAAAKHAGLAPKAGKALKLLGAGVLISDVLMRGYVIAVLDKDPTFSPVLTIGARTLGGTARKVGQSTATKAQYLERHDSANRREPADKSPPVDAGVDAGSVDARADAGSAHIK